MQSPPHVGSDPVPAPGAGDNGGFCSCTQRKYVLVAAILASALGFIDGSVLAVAMPAIRADLGASLAQAQWVSNAYALSLSALILIGGAAGDRFGLRRTFVAGIALFVLSSLACAAAPDPAMLIAFRAIQGLGAAIMVPGSLAIIAKAYPKSERGGAIGIWAAASALTTAAGPVIGGLALSVFGDSVWRAIFAINLPLGLVSIYLLLARVPDDTPAGRQKLDLGGGLLAILAFGALAYGLTALNERSGPGIAISSLVAGLALLAIFIGWELRRSQPMVDLSLFGNRGFAGANAATFFLYFALSANLFYLPMLLIAGWSLGTAEVGFIFLPLSGAIALLSGPVGKLSDSIGPRFPIAAGSLLVAFAFAGLGFMTAAGIHRFWLGAFPLMTVMGLGMALVVSPLSAAVMTVVDDRQTGAASGINNAVSRIAGLIAVASMGSLAAWVYSGVADPAGPGLPGFGEIPGAALSADADAMRLAASDAAFAAVAWVTAALCVLSALTAWATVDGQALPWSSRAGTGPLDRGEGT